jgi:protein-S-isoprenylcysteine O-methyltransferase Ste14
MTDHTYLASLGLAWAGYGLVHSLLASDKCKELFQTYFPGLFPAYRLLYNVIAGLMLLPPLWLLFTYDGELLWRWPGALGWAANAAALLALAGFLWTLKTYDSGEFLGIRQIQHGTGSDDQAPMVLSDAHRFVRHPWYFLGLVVIWTREMNAALLVSALVLTLYLALGSRLEERKLLQRYGEAYRRYRARVPALLPLPWRHLNRSEAASILAMQRASGGNGRRD